MPLLSTTRRKFIRLAAAAGVAAVAVDSTLFEPNRPRIIRQEIALRRWPEQLNGFTIALLSDFHYDRHCSVHPLRAAIPMVNGLHPDLIALTGDFVSYPLFSPNYVKGALAAEPCAELLRQMQAPYGSWAVMGNHDFFTDPVHVTAALQAQGIQILKNESVPIELKGTRFWLAGVGDVIGGAANLDASLQHAQAEEATILLAHEPDYADRVARQVAAKSVDLQLSGHSHGGQVRLPLMRPLYLPELAKKYISGLYKIGPLTLYTNSGLGTVGVPVRWNCPPEITLLTLRSSGSVS
ncbi:MAG TPA: metallophosphoesterase [Candidatus Sulfotelmatobacter sp.]|nr:metallophosphoesterase [Candidatus Sulfotelmatobacter sp.]